ncbi:MAG: PAS domain-containing protein, partial [bacterium]
MQSDAHPLNDRSADARRQHRAPLAVWTWTPQSGRTWHAASLLAHLGHPGTLGDDEWWDRVHPDDRANARSAHARACAATVSEYEVAYRVHGADGAHLLVVEAGVISRDAQGTVIDAYGSLVNASEPATDIETERSARLMRGALDAIPNFIGVKDHDGRFTLANRALAESFGMAPHELLGRTEADMGASAEAVAAWRQIDLEVMDTRRDMFVQEEEYHDLAGNLRWFQTHKRAIVDDDGIARHVL